MNGNVKHGSIQERFACPSCVNHFETMDDYKKHLETHIIPSDDDDITHHSKRRRKSFVAIPSRQKNNTVTFSTTTYLNPPNFARFPQNVVDALGSILDIETSTANETNFDSLLSFPAVQSFLSAGLKQSLDDLPRSVWTEQLNANTQDEKQLCNAVRFLLTSFANSCSTTAINTKPCKDYERTFWVEHVVPIFHVFSKQTGLLSFNWCEVETIHHALEDMDEWFQKGNPRYVDGLGYDKNGIERVVLEGSSGERTVNVDKTVDDSVKQLSSLISMLKGIANSHLNAKFDTLLATKVFGIQSVKTNIILFELKFKDHGRFTYHEVRSAEIPTTYTQRNKWLKIFEILCYLFIALKEQHVNYEALENEEHGAILVVLGDIIRMGLK
jgi:hypothetical protein